MLRLSKETIGTTSYSKRLSKEMTKEHLDPLENNYRIGIGAYRYWIVFFIAAVALTIKYVIQMSVAKRHAWWEV